MSSPLITISSKSSPSEAADMMLQHNVRHLLVVDRGDDDNNNTSNLNKPIGIITPLDFTRYQEYANDKDKDTIEKILEYYI
jgi:CBS domain-containing protein